MRAWRAARPVTQAVKSSGSADVSNGSSAAVVPPADPFANKEVYKDNIFDRFMINYFSRTMSNELGGELGY